MVEEIQNPEVPEEIPEVTEESPEFIIGLSPRAKQIVENLINSGLDWRVALLQLMVWTEPVYLDIEPAEQAEQAEPEQTSQN